ncbi:hypothetical protein CCP3SC1_40032 [Gammaproteobacteria bacterium]
MAAMTAARACFISDSAESVGNSAWACENTARIKAVNNTEDAIQHDVSAPLVKGASEVSPGFLLRSDLTFCVYALSL